MPLSLLDLNIVYIQVVCVYVCTLMKRVGSASGHRQSPKMADKGKQRRTNLWQGRQLHKKLETAEKTKEVAEDFV